RARAGGGARRTEDAMTAAVDARDVFRIHRTAEGDAAALKGLTLRIDDREVVAVLGPSGSGKSTLMMVLAGLERPSAGSARVAGQDLALLDEDGLARLRQRHIGIVFQSFHLLSTMTALENVAIPLELAGHPDAV